MWRTEGSNRYYIQSVRYIPDEEKRKQKINSLQRISDSFKKIAVVRDDIILWRDENGILYIGIGQSLLDSLALEST